MHDQSRELRKGILPCGGALLFKAAYTEEGLDLLLERNSESHSVLIAKTVDGFRASGSRLPWRLQLRNELLLINYPGFYSGQVCTELHYTVPIPLSGTVFLWRILRKIQIYKLIYIYIQYVYIY